MVIYNVTIQVNWSINDAWLQWLQNEQIPDTMATGIFTHHRLVKLLECDETDGPTYAIQYFTTSLANYSHFMNYFANAIRKKGTDKWGSQFVEFSTVMQVLH